MRLARTAVLPRDTENGRKALAMNRPTSLLILLAASLLVFPSACKHTAKPGSDQPAATTPTPPVPEDIVVGIINFLGSNSQFVIIQIEPGQEAKDGEELIVRFAGADVGKVKVLPQRKAHSVAADVIEGSVEKNYEVVRRSIR